MNKGNNKPKKYVSDDRFRVNFYCMHNYKWDRLKTARYYIYTVVTTY